MEPSHELQPAGATQHLQFQAGERLPFGAPHSNILALTAGRVRIGLVNDAGKLVSLDVLGPGEVLGPLGNLHAAADSPIDESANEATSLEAGEALVYSATAFWQMLGRNSELLQNYCAQIDGRRRRIEARLVRIVFKSSMGKIAGLIAEFAERFGESESNAIRIPLRLTHKDLGSFVGVKRETVTMSLADLEYREIIYSRGGYLYVVDPDMLLRIP